jgi:hypothetical protein
VDLPRARHLAECRVQTKQRVFVVLAPMLRNAIAFTDNLHPQIAGFSEAIETRGCEISTSARLLVPHQPRRAGILQVRRCARARPPVRDDTDGCRHTSQGRWNAGEGVDTDT